ncbi:MAG TPA: ABC transporter ATP-binding protein, partial [Actinomycetota bacterium]|nr:ABC transporter ATP-binding protein [Actinomycetota bacterium]
MPPKTTAPILELIDVYAAYGRITVLHGVDLIVPEGSVVALLGPNGAGKTSTIKVAAGQLRPKRGCFHVAGRHVNGSSPDSLARAGVCTIPEGRGIFPNLTVRENLQMVTYASASLPTIEERSYQRFPILAERRSQLAGTLSGGEQQMLSISRALAVEPTLLMLDEISMGLAPQIVEELYELVAQIASEGVSILLVEQYAHMAMAVADYVAVMAHGRITAMGEPGDMEEELR